MADPRPHLRAVPDRQQQPAGSSAAGGPATRTAFWVLIFAVVLCALVAAWQKTQVDSLEARVAGLEAELATARAQTAAWQSHVGEIRGAITDLRTQVEALDALAERDPATP